MIIPDPIYNLDSVQGARSTKTLGGTGKSFSHRLVDAMKNAAVDWRDIYPGITAESLDAGAQFPINELRNQMLHEGEYPEDYSPVFTEIGRARTLCERLISTYIGVDAKNLDLG